MKGKKYLSAIGMLTALILVFAACITASDDSGGGGGGSASSAASSNSSGISSSSESSSSSSSNSSTSESSVSSESSSSSSSSSESSSSASSESSSSSSLSSTANLIAWYRFENNGNDSIGSYNLTASSSPLPVPLPSYSDSEKKEGSYSLYLNNNSTYSTAYMSVEGVSMNLSAGMTVSAWVYLKSDVDYEQWPTIITLNYLDAGNNTWYYYSLCVDPFKHIQIFENSLNPTYSANEISPVTWYHIVFTIDTANNVTVYLDGTSLGSMPVGNNLTTNFSDIEVGTFGNSYSWEGYLDDVRIYNKVLSASEVSAL